MFIEFISQAGNIHARGKQIITLESAKTVDSGMFDENNEPIMVDVPESDYSNAPALVQAAFVAVKDLAERSEGKAVFDSRTATIRYGSDTVTPETDVSAYPADIQSFVQAIYTFNDNEQTKIWNAIQAEVIEAENREPEPLTPEQEKELARRKIIKTYTDTIDALQSGYTEQEVKTFDQKAKEAEIVLSGSDKPTPILSALSAGTGQDKTELAQTVADKAMAYAKDAGAAEAAMEVALAQLEAQ